MYDLLKTALDVSALRRDVISNNLTNIDTKNFKRSSVKFEEYLNSSVKAKPFKKTNEKHMSIGYDNYRLVQERGDSMRSDKNNVDIDIEKANQAANTLMYNSLITAMNNKFQMLSTILKSGR